MTAPTPQHGVVDNHAVIACPSVVMPDGRTRSDLRTHVYLDGNMWCAVEPDFVDLQSSIAGFGPTPREALLDLVERLGLRPLASSWAMWPSPCPVCCSKPSAGRDGGPYYVLSCPECYDGAPDSGSRNMLGSGRTLNGAIADWNERMAEWEPTP